MPILGSGKLHPPAANCRTQRQTVIDSNIELLQCQRRPEMLICWLPPLMAYQYLAWLGHQIASTPLLQLTYLFDMGVALRAH